MVALSCVGCYKCIYLQHLLVTCSLFSTMLFTTSAAAVDVSFSTHSMYLSPYAKPRINIATFYFLIIKPSGEMNLKYIPTRFWISNAKVTHRNQWKYFPICCVHHQAYTYVCILTKIVQWFHMAYDICMIFRFLNHGLTQLCLWKMRMLSLVSLAEWLLWNHCTCMQMLMEIHKP